jgi:hypothetical protein
VSLSQSGIANGVQQRQVTQKLFNAFADGVGNTLGCANVSEHNGQLFHLLGHGINFIGDHL